jgi:hypothetical protein
VTARLLLVAWLAGGVALLPVRRSPGCAVAPPPGQWAAAYAETAVVIWDAPAQVEHFTREASFTGTSADFGFLVPTPGRPTLAPATWPVGDRLVRVTAPRTEVRKRLAEFGCMPQTKVASAGAPKAVPPMADRVQVVERTRVGGFDAAVLKATDADALRDWLGRNGYASRPALRGWLGDTVGDGWHLTAFKVAADPAGATALGSLTPVRLTFPTGQPMYPYKEPADAAPPGSPPSRLLRLFVLAPVRMEATAGLGIGAAAMGNWQFRTVWAGPIDAPTFAEAATACGLSAAEVSSLAGRPWVLTEFEDTASPRPAGFDLGFRPSADPSPVERPPVIVYEDMHWPYAAGGAAVVVGLPPAAWLVWRGVRRLVRQLPAAPLD